MNALLGLMILGIGLLILSGCAPDRRDVQYGQFACGWGAACDTTGPVDYGQAYGSPLPRSAPWPHSLPY